MIISDYHAGGGTGRGRSALLSFHLGKWGMRKRIVNQLQPHISQGSGQSWLDLGQIATVEVTSEDPRFPIDAALQETGGTGWRASEPGTQRIRLIFDEPVSVHRIHLHFVEPERERTQEFTLRWSSANGGTSREIVRQQWNFSPAGSTTEVEDYHVSLDDVAVLELAIDPDVSRESAPATLAMWRLA